MPAKLSGANCVTTNAVRTHCIQTENVVNACGAVCRFQILSLSLSLSLFGTLRLAIRSNKICVVCLKPHLRSVSLPLPILTPEEDG